MWVLLPQWYLPEPDIKVHLLAAPGGAGDQVTLETLLHYTQEMN